MAHILIVDDAAVQRIELREVLEGAGHTVYEAEDGLKGLDTLKSNGDKIQMVITDLNMPELDGISMCQRIQDEHGSLPIFMLTTEASAELKADGKKVGVLAWIKKPMNPKVIISGVQKVLAKKAA